MSLRRIKMPNAGILEADGKLNKAGHHYLEQLQQVPAAVADLQDQMTALGLTGTGGVFLLATEEVDFEIDLVTVTGLMTFDDTIPQDTEGDEVLSGVYTTLSGTSRLKITVDLLIGGDAVSTQTVAVALFYNSGADAVCTSAVTAQANALHSVHMEHWIDSPGADRTVAVAVRMGGSSANAYLNGRSTGRFFGGTFRSMLRIDEYEAH